jgi:asparagine synthetase B (glutamine-hydrolysing)
LTWKLEVDEPPIAFRADPVADAVHTQRTRAALSETFAALDVDRSRWVLPLSGGYDSRAILLRMHDRQGLKCITWGLREASHKPETDAAVARKVATFLGVPHQYFETDLMDGLADRILDRFLIAGEGRGDQIFGYMDGFELWRSLSLAGTVGIIRGDHGFGHRVVSNPDEARLRVGLKLWSDYQDVPALADLNMKHLEEQRIPAPLEHHPGESAADWRDRLFHAFRVPSVYAALNELKSAYVEIVSPLLVRRLVELARTHPEHLRTGKKLFRDVTSEDSIPVPYADAHATADADAALGHPSMVEQLLDEIFSARAREIFSSEFAAFVAERLRGPDKSRRRSSPLTRALKRALPKQLTKPFAGRPAWRTLSGKRLALRAFLISRMSERLRMDARARSV